MRRSAASDRVDAQVLPEERDFLTLPDLARRLSTTTHALQIRIHRAVTLERRKTGRQDITIVGGDDRLPPLAKLFGKWGTWQPAFSAWVAQRAAKLIESREQHISRGRPRKNSEPPAFKGVAQC